MAVETGNELCVCVCVCRVNLGRKKITKGNGTMRIGVFRGGHARKTGARKKVVVFGFHLRARANVQPYRDRNKREKECL